MENSTAQIPISNLLHRLAQEIADAVAAMRYAESALEFELAAEALERVRQEMEWVGSIWGA